MEIRVARNGKEIGSFDEASLTNAVLRGVVQRNDWAWHEGLVSWIAVGELVDRGAVPPTPPTKEAIDGRDWTQDIATMAQLSHIREYSVEPSRDLTKAQARDLLDQLALKYPKIAASIEKQSSKQRTNPIRDIKQELREAERQLKAARTDANTQFHRESIKILKQRLRDESASASSSSSGCGCGCLPFIVAIIVAYAIYILISQPH